MLVREGEENYAGDLLLVWSEAALRVFELFSKRLMSGPVYRDFSYELNGRRTYFSITEHGNVDLVVSLL